MALWAMRVGKAYPYARFWDRAGVQAGAKDVTFGGGLRLVLMLPETPDFAKALDLDHARDGEVMVGLRNERRGSALVKRLSFTTYRARILRDLIPGSKHLNEKIMVTDQSFEGYWIAKAYRNSSQSCGPHSAWTVWVRKRAH